MKDTETAPQHDLVALLGSRLCHDLISPIGAIGNGLELLELTSGSAGGDEIGLIRASVEAATARIKFFRLAFGAAGADATVGAREAKAVLAAMYRDSRTNLRWQDDEDHPRAEVRLGFLALACLENAMPWGGTVEVRRSPGAWVIHAQADRLKIDSLLWEGLGKADLPTDLKPAEVQFGVLKATALDLRRPISVTASETSLSLLV